MHPSDQQAIRKIATTLLQLLPEQGRGAEAARAAFALARAAVEQTVGTKQTDQEHERMIRRFCTPR